MLLYLGQKLPGQLLDVVKQRLFFKIAKGDCLAAESRPPCAADSVYIGFGNIGEIVIYYVRKLLNIKSACSNICCNKYSDFSLFEIAQCLLSAGLGFVAVNCHRDEAPFAQFFDYFICAVLCF